MTSSGSWRDSTMPHSADWYANWKKPVIEHGVPTSYGWIVLHPEAFFMGNQVDIGFGSLIQAESVVVLEDRVELGSHVSIYSADSISGTRGKVTVKEGACVGSHAIVFPGVTVGEYSLVDAGCIVTKDVPPKSRLRMEKRYMVEPYRRLWERREMYLKWLYGSGPR